MTATAFTLTGNVGSAELRHTPSGRPVLSLRIAVDRRRFNRDAQQWETVATDWHQASLWGEKGEALSRVLTKGDRVIVTGSLESREYDKDGEKRVAWEIKANEVGIVARVPRREATSADVDAWNVDAAAAAADPWATDGAGEGPAW